MSKNEASSSKAWVPIITAIIGVVGTIAVAYFSFRGLVVPKELEISATQTAESLRATQTVSIAETQTLVQEIIETSISTDNATQQAIMGYTLFWDGEQVGHEPNWTCRAALENLLWNIKQYPNKKVTGWFNGKIIDVAGTGYELFWDCERVGFEPQWSKEQATENLLSNMKYPDRDVEGLFNGEILIP